MPDTAAKMRRTKRTGCHASGTGVSSGGQVGVGTGLAVGSGMGLAVGVAFGLLLAVGAVFRLLLLEVIGLASGIARIRLK
jgi:hypothetical protein